MVRRKADPVRAKKHPEDKLRPQYSQLQRSPKRIVPIKKKKEKKKETVGISEKKAKELWTSSRDLGGSGSPILKLKRNGSKVG